MKTTVNGREALNWGVSFLQKHESDSCIAWLEASLLLGKACNKDRIKLLITLDSLLEEEDWDRYRELVQRRMSQEPLQYLLGEQEFMSLHFKVTPDVLIPRGETELLVEEALSVSRTFKSPKILDLCTGSGAVAISLAYHLPRCEMWAVDISAAALDVARENARENGVQDRVKFYCGDLFLPLGSKRKYHLITCNPPYISEEEYPGLSLQVKKEPYLALYGGQDGLDFYRSIGKEASGFLLKGGFLLVEIGWKQGAAVREIFAQNGFTGIGVLKDWNGHDRVVTGQKP